MITQDKDIDVNAASSQRSLVVTIPAPANNLTGVKVAQFKLPVAIEITGINVATLADAGGNSVDVKVATNSVLAAAVVPAAGHVAGTPHATASRRKIAKNTAFDVLLTTTSVATWVTIVINYRVQGLRGS